LLFVAFAVLALNQALAISSPAPVVGDLAGLVLSVLALAALWIIRDIMAEHEATDETLRASEAKFASAFRNSPDAVFLTSIPEGVILEANEGITRILGYEPDEVRGKTVRETGIWAHLEDRERIQELLRRDGRVANMEADFRHKDGSTRTGMVAGEIIQIEGAPYMVSVTRDVTALKRAQEERARMIEELEVKNAELERFVYTVSHDLRAPLVTIRGFLGLAEQDIARGDLEQTLEDLGRIRTASETMSQLLDELLELSRIGRVVHPAQEVDFGELARQAAAMVAAQIAERGAAVEIAPGLPVVMGDRQRLLEVLQNLVENAVKFMGDQPAPRVDVGVRDGDGGAVFFVRDNGAGIPPRYHEKVFELFDRLDPSIPGTGIGLALVKRIVEVHGGRVWVESAGAAGKGSTFCFTLKP
jgi:PAS domain S-box-containing protein